MNPIRRGNIYTLVVLATQILVIFLLASLAPVIASLPFSMAVSALVTQLLYFIPPFFAYLVVTNTKVTQVCPAKPLNITNTVLIIFMCLSIQPALGLLSAVTSFAFENHTDEFISELLDYPFPLTLLITAVLPAVLEELTMRGIVLKNYNCLPIKQAALVNGLFFAILHLNPQQFAYAFVMGVVFSYFVYYSDSIWSAILGHFIINASQITLAFASYKTLGGIESVALEEPTTVTIINAVIFLVVTTAIFLPVFLILFRTFINYNRRRVFLDTLSGDLDLDITPPEQPESPPKIFDWAFAVILVIYTLFTALFAFMGK